MGKVVHRDARESRCEKGHSAGEDTPKGGEESPFTGRENISTGKLHGIPFVEGEMA